MYFFPCIGIIFSDLQTIIIGLNYMRRDTYCHGKNSFAAEYFAGCTSPFPFLPADS